MPADKTWSVALTYRPTGGVQFHHEGWLYAYLLKYASQWEFYEEYVDDDDTTRHFHGRILLKVQTRMDKVKVALIRTLHAELAEKKVLMRGIRFLYDDWEYSRKDGSPLPGLTHLTDEDLWQYADPAAKRVKKKNSRVLFHLEYIREKLPYSTITSRLVEEHLRPFVASGEIELPGSEAGWKNLLWGISFYWNATVAHPPPTEDPPKMDLEIHSDSDSPY